MKNQFLRFNDGLYRACIWIAGLSFLTITLIIPWGIFSRYILGIGAQWPEPISVFLVSILTFLGAAASYRAGAHIAVTMMTARLPEAQRKAMDILVQLLMGATCLFMLIWGVTLCSTTWGQYNNALPWLRVGMAYMSIPVSAGITLLFIVEKILCGDQSARPVMCFTHAENNQGAA